VEHEGFLPELIFFSGFKENHMAVRVPSIRLYLKENDPLQKTAKKISLLDQKIDVLMQSILKGENESVFRVLERDVSRTICDIETLYSTSVKTMQQSYSPKRWKSALCGIQVLLKNIDIVKNHVCRFREFARLSECAAELSLKAHESLSLSDKARLSEKRKIKEEFDFIKYEVSALIETFAFSFMTPCQEERYDALIETMDDLQALILEL